MAALRARPLPASLAADRRGCGTLQARAAAVWEPWRSTAAATRAASPAVADWVTLGPWVRGIRSHRTV
jgi:hypothetical protein